jgi:hypothetical protein
MHIRCGSTAYCYLPKGKDTYIHIRSTSVPEATVVQLGPAQLNLYELASSNRNAAYSQQSIILPDDVLASRVTELVDIRQHLLRLVRISSSSGPDLV